MGLTIEEVDKLTGSGQPKSATFRTVDGWLDTLVHVAQRNYENPNDEQHELFKLPDFVNKWWKTNGW
jgi:3-hydroxyacyl-CoA dehydrogenase